MNEMECFPDIAGSNRKVKCMTVGRVCSAVHIN